METRAPEEEKAPEPVRYSLAVVMTSFNRREKTLQCLERLFAQRNPGTFTLAVYLVDDASTDGTAEAVASRWPGVQVLAGDGDLFWTRGMHRAFGAALARGFDGYLWLNDDTMLQLDAVQRMVSAWCDLKAAGQEGILTGSTYDAGTGLMSYGGFRWLQGWQRRLAPVEPDFRLCVSCDTMNGNCTLIPHSVASVLGNLDPAFQHSFGDFDYGLRARLAGLPVWVMPGFAGTCSDNSYAGTWRDRARSFRQRWRHLNSPKGSPFRQWSLYCRRHLGYLWPLYAVSPFLKTLAGAGRRMDGGVSSS